MNRHQYISPGYDHLVTTCRADGRPCGHGRGSERWVYEVGHGTDAALTLTVHADKYLHGVPGRGCGPEGSDLSLHVNYKTDREQVRTNSTMSECSAVAGGKCYCPYSTSLEAEEFFKVHGSVDGHEQPESFWLAMETHYRKVAAEYPRIDYVRCPHCDGTGTVRGPS